MATTVKDSTLTSVITDSVTLNGTTYGSTNTLSVTSIDEVYQRIMKVPAFQAAVQDFVSVMSASASPNSGGDVDIAQFKYARFTNLDDTYNLYLKVGNTDGVCDDTSPTKSYCVKIPPLCSYLITSDTWFSNDGDIRGSNVTGASAWAEPSYWTVFGVGEESAGTDGIEMEVFVSTK